MTGLNTLERDDLLRRIAWLNSEVDKIKRMLKGEQVGTARIADAAITNAKIVNLTWDKAQGGTATLGGIDNGNGLLQIKDIDGNIIVTLDKDGVLVEGGKIVIKNNEEVTMIEGGNIIGANVFRTGFIIKDDNEQELTGDYSFQDITDLAFTGLSFENDTPVLVFGNIFYSSSGYDANLLLRISDGVNTYPSTEFIVPSGEVDALAFHTFSFTHIITIPAGRTLLKIQCARSTTDETIKIFGVNEHSSFGYLILGN
jgi:hypothetical protein